MVSKRARIGQILILIGILWSSIPIVAITMEGGASAFAFAFFNLHYSAGGPLILGTIILGIISFYFMYKNDYRTAIILGLISGLMGLISFLNIFILLGSLVLIISPEAKLKEKTMK